MGKGINSAIALLSILGSGLILCGIAFLFAATHQHPRPFHPIHPIWPFVIYAGVFFVFGGGIIAMAIFGGRLLDQDSNLEADYPNQPWMWKAEWASGNIPDHLVASGVVAWIVALVASGIAFPVAIAGLQDCLKRHNYRGLAGLIFLPVAIAFLFSAVQKSRRIGKFGKSTLRLQTLPARIGGTLAGTICVERPVESFNEIKLRLVCINRIQAGSGKNQTSFESVKWEDQQVLHKLSPCKTGSDIPVSFRIPEDASPHDESNRRDQILWRLECSADCLGINYRTQFNVPVFAA